MGGNTGARLWYPNTRLSRLTEMVSGHWSHYNRYTHFPKNVSANLKKGFADQPGGVREICHRFEDMWIKRLF
jgi:hypothetical protein